MFERKRDGTRMESDIIASLGKIFDKLNNLINFRTKAHFSTGVVLDENAFQISIRWLEAIGNNPSSTSTNSLG